MLDVAKERLTDFDNIELHALSRNDLSGIEDNSIDKIYTVAVFCHLDKEDLFNYMREFYRVLKPGGIVYVETWNMASKVGWKRWQAEADDWAIANHSQRKDVARNQFCSPDEFDLYVTKANFDILGSYNKSVWNQVIAGKSMDSQSKQQAKKYVAENIDKIIYSEIFTELFDHIMSVDHGSMHPSVMMKYINSLGDIPEAKLYKRFLIGFWKDNENRIGKYEENLSN